MSSEGFYLYFLINIIISSNFVAAHTKEHSILFYTHRYRIVFNAWFKIKLIKRLKYDMVHCSCVTLVVHNLPICYINSAMFDAFAHKQIANRRWCERHLSHVPIIYCLYHKTATTAKIYMRWAPIIILRASSAMLSADFHTGPPPNRHIAPIAHAVCWHSSRVQSSSSFLLVCAISWWKMYFRRNVQMHYVDNKSTNTPSGIKWNVRARDTRRWNNCAFAFAVAINCCGFSRAVFFCGYSSFDQRCIKFPLAIVALITTSLRNEI